MLNELLVDVIEEFIKAYLDEFCHTRMQKDICLANIKKYGWECFHSRESKMFLIDMLSDNDISFDLSDREFIDELDILLRCVSKKI